MGGRGSATDRASTKFGGGESAGRASAASGGGAIIDNYGKEEQAMARKIFGKNMTGQELATMAGANAFSGATVEFGVRDGKLEINIFHKKITEATDDGGGMKRTFYKDRGGAKIRNDAFFLKESAQGQGLGAKSLASQVRAAQKAGVKEINTFALTDGRGSVGHKVWADLGYNGKLSTRVQTDWKNANPLESLRGVKPPTTIHELYARGGRSFWARRGESQNMVFKLNRGSKSVKILETYIKNKGYKI